MCEMMEEFTVAGHRTLS